jgi:hypothetical protein
MRNKKDNTDITRILHHETLITIMNWYPTHILEINRK